MEAAKLNLVKDTPAEERDAKGRFKPGHRGGPGNPHAGQIAKLRAALLETATVQDVKDVYRAMVEKAKKGDVLAAREILDRCLGKSPALLVEKMGEGEALKLYDFNPETDEGGASE
jgi:hypothetical protein